MGFNGQFSSLDPGQVLKGAFDDATGRLKTDTQVTANISAAQEVIISHTDDSIKIGDGTRLAGVTTSNELKSSDATAQASLSSIDEKQDYSNFQSSHQTLSAGTDTTITFSQAVRMVRVTNWDTSNVVLVKNGSISSNTDSTSSRVGVAPAANVSNSETFPITTSSIHVRSAGASEITVEGFY